MIVNHVRLKSIFYEVFKLDIEENLFFTLIGRWKLVETDEMNPLLNRVF